MAKVFARETTFIGAGDNREVKLEKGELWDADDKFVLAHSTLFAPVQESTDARMAAMERLVDEQAAQIEALLAATETKTPAKKATAGKPAAGTELKGDVA